MSSEAQTRWITGIIMILLPKREENKKRLWMHKHLFPHPSPVGFSLSPHGMRLLTLPAGKVQNTKKDNSNSLFSSFISGRSYAEVSQGNREENQWLKKGNCGAEGEKPQEKQETAF